MKLKLIAAIYLLVSAVSAFADVAVSPMDIDLVGNQRSANIQFRSYDKDDLVYDVSIRTRNDEPVAAADSPVMAYPPVLRIKPGATQVVRVVRKDTKQIKDLAMYRVAFVQRAETSKSTLNMSLPVFLAPTDAKGEASAQIVAGALNVQNVGKGRITINRILLGDEVVKVRLHLLPGESWLSEQDAPAGKVSVEIAAGNVINL